MIRARLAAAARAAILVCAVLASIAAPAAAQAPAAGAPRGFQLPAYTKATLKNGLVVYVMPSKRLPLVDLRLVVNAGAMHDPAGREGLAGLTAAMLTQGAGARDAKQIADDIEFVGGDLSADADPERIVVTCEVLSKDLDTGLGIFRDVIAAPTFPAADFERKKQETLGNLASGRDDPETVADRALLPFLYGAGPLAHPVDGWEAGVQALAREDVAAFHARFVRPNRAALAVVGDVDAATIVSKLEKAFADWKPGGDAPAQDPDTRTGITGRQVRVIEKPEVTQTQIRLACPGVPRNHPDYFPIRVANTILGSGFTSRLVNEIRVVQGLTYNIRSRQDMGRGSGAFVIRTFTRNETLRKCVDAVIGEVRKLRDGGPTEAELDKAKRFLTGQFPLGLQAPDDLAALLLDIHFYGLDPKFVESFGPNVQAVTMDDVRRALKSYFCVEDLRLLVVSNPGVAKQALDGLGAIEVKPIP